MKFKRRSRTAILVFSLFAIVGAGSYYSEKQIENSILEDYRFSAVDSNKLANLSVFPDDSPWRQDISTYPVHPKSDVYIRNMGKHSRLHPDFGTVWEGLPIGIPVTLAKGSEEKIYPVFKYKDESDPGPYPLSDDTLIEAGLDKHALLLDLDNLIVYELGEVKKDGNRWYAGAGAIFDLKSSKLRPLKWTSADAAGLSIFAGLVRYEEVYLKGRIDHALRFTVSKTRRGFILPATHYASFDSNPELPPMGLRLRLKSHINIENYPYSARVILAALQRYGMLLADNGSDLFLSGSPHPDWDMEELNSLKKITVADFEVVYTGPVIE